jgi:hypothetical protein
MSKMTSVNLVISVLGGNQQVAKITHSNPKSVSNWKNQQRFPASTYVSLTQALKRMGLTANTELWAMRGAKSKARR